MFSFPFCSLPFKAEIVIEERNGEEITQVGDTVIAPVGCPVYNPAFDVCPARYITGIITEEGICYRPFEASLKKAKLAAQRRNDANMEALVASYKKK